MEFFLKRPSNVLKRLSSSSSKKELDGNQW